MRYLAIIVLATLVGCGGDSGESSEFGHEEGTPDHVSHDGFEIYNKVTIAEVQSLHYQGQVFDHVWREVIDCLNTKDLPRKLSYDEPKPRIFLIDEIEGRTIGRYYADIENIEIEVFSANNTRLKKHELIHHLLDLAGYPRKLNFGIAANHVHSGDSDVWACQF